MAAIDAVRAVSRGPDEDGRERVRNPHPEPCASRHARAVGER